MTLGTKEHYELMDVFEREFSHLRLDREAKDMWAKGAVYQSGVTNELFRAYRRGVSYGRATAEQIDA